MEDDGRELERIKQERIKYFQELKNKRKTIRNKFDNLNIMLLDHNIKDVYRFKRRKTTHFVYPFKSLRTDKRCLCSYCITHFQDITPEYYDYFMRAINKL